jgi:hypothetical protein
MTFPEEEPEQVKARKAVLEAIAVVAPNASAEMLQQLGQAYASVVAPGGNPVVVRR